MHPGMSGRELDEFFNLLKRLADAFGIPGYEEEVRSIIIDELKPYADELWVDRLGNVVAVKKGSGDARVMVAAHMDEIGLMVKSIDEHGFLYIAPVGGWSDIILPGQRLRIMTRSGKLVYGVVGTKPPHVMTPEEAKQVIPIDKLFVDVGASSRKEVEEMGIQVGSPIDLDREAVRIGKHRATGKAFDDRVGVAVMIEAFKRLAERGVEATVYAVATVQEETGLKGARTIAYALQPDAALSIDVTIAADVPGVEEPKHITKLGKGPAIKIIDGRSGSGTISDKRIVRLLEEAAREEGIPFQYEVATGGTTDATAIQLTRSGVPVSAVSIPTRYIHSPVEVLDLRDAVNAARLIAAAVARMTPSWFREVLPPRRVYK